MTLAPHAAAGEMLRTVFGPDRIRTHASLAPLTTFKVGGPADLLLFADSGAEVRRAAAIARDAGLPVTMLGGGSNVLVSDEGVRGLVIRMRGGQVVQVAPDRLRADGGVTINGVVRWAITHGLANLEAWAGTPGTVGGAIYGNAHFRGRDIGELVAGVCVLVDGTRVEEVMAHDMEFAYDSSRLQRTGEVLLSADFRVTPGAPDVLRAVARESLAYRKRTQPLASPSAGCIFQNPDPSRDRLPDGVSWSAGALIDGAGLKGAVEGGARVSSIHGNFIVHDGHASAADIRRLIARCQHAVAARYGVALREEIVYLGFEQTCAGPSADAEA